MKKILLCLMLASSIMYGADDLYNATYIQFIGTVRRIAETTDSQWIAVCNMIERLQECVGFFGTGMPIIGTDTLPNKNACAQHLADELTSSHLYLVDDITFGTRVARLDSNDRQDEWNCVAQLLLDIESCSQEMDVARAIVLLSDK